MTARHITRVRQLLAAQNPFIFGGYVDRPAPAHVLNGLVASLLGVSPSANSIRRLIAGSLGAFEDFAFTHDATWMEHPTQADHFREDLSALFNPDLRLWAKVGSPVPVHGRFANNDPSDDGFGPLVGHMLISCGPTGWRENFERLLLPVDVGDPATALSVLVAAGAEPGPLRPGFASKLAWWAGGGSATGRHLGGELARFAVAATDPTAAGRAQQLRELSRAAYFVTILALMYGPLAAGASGDACDSISDIAGLVVWADTPPGQMHHPLVQASTHSFRRVVSHVVAALTESLQDAFAGVEIPSDLPKRQTRRYAIRAQLLAGGASPTNVDAQIDAMCADAGVAADGTKIPDPNWCWQMVGSAFSDAYVTRGLRSMGVKIGFVGPTRGFGAPRFVCETPLLATIVAGLCGGRSTDFEEFVDRARERLGLILGPGTDDGIAAKLKLWEGASVGLELLRENQDCLRERLVRSGLAHEYSDGHTEVTGDFESARAAS